MVSNKKDGTRDIVGHFVRSMSTPSKFVRNVPHVPRPILLVRKHLPQVVDPLFFYASLVPFSWAFTTPTFLEWFSCPLHFGIRKDREINTFSNVLWDVFPSLRVWLRSIVKIFHFQKLVDFIYLLPMEFLWLSRWQFPHKLQCRYQINSSFIFVTKS